MDISSLLQQVASYQNWAIVQDPQTGGYKLEIATEYGRTQIVQVTGGQDPEGRMLLYIWSVVCDASAIGDPYYLLRLNADMPYGALALRDPHVILMETQLIETADAEEIQRAVYYVGKQADELEKQVYGNVDQQ